MEITDDEIIVQTQNSENKKCNDTEKIKNNSDENI